MHLRHSIALALILSSSAALAVPAAAAGSMQNWSTTPEQGTSSVQRNYSSHISGHNGFSATTDTSGYGSSSLFGTYNSNDNGFGAIPNRDANVESKGLSTRQAENGTGTGAPGGTAYPNHTAGNAAGTGDGHFGMRSAGNGAHLLAADTDHDTNWSWLGLLGLLGLAGLRGRNTENQY
ncbi:WGxxGxxG-CTERM domain-containing protein [Paenibacillus sp. S-38]|uniref:WGxxGxxG-CTERM domain-containing protein n=1 Tax=Paenibacillus sp. S-38 TaxID=3416710 RepID=UPI003CEBE8B8